MPLYQPPSPADLQRGNLKHDLREVLYNALLLVNLEQWTTIEDEANRALELVRKLREIGR